MTLFIFFGLKIKFSDFSLTWNFFLCQNFTLTVATLVMSLFILWDTFVFQAPGFLVGMKEDSLLEYEYPDGEGWQRMFKQGLFKRQTFSD